MALPAQSRNLVANPAARTNLNNWLTGGTGTLTRKSSNGRWWVEAQPNTWTYASGTGVVGRWYAARIRVQGPVGATFSTASTDNTSGPFGDSRSYTIPASGEVFAIINSAYAVSGTSLAFGISNGATAVDVTEALMIEVSGPGQEPGPYFDGSTVESGWTHAWTGTVDGSISTRDVYGVWPEQSADAGAPKVQVTVIGLGNTSVTTRVTRDSGSETWTIPGWKQRNTVGGATFTDFAPPLGRPVTYTLIVNGSAVSSRTITVQSTQGWVQSPIQPELSMPISLDGSDPNQLSLAKPSLKDYKYASRGDEEYAMGGRYAIARSTARGGAEGVTFVMYARTDAVSDTFQALMASSPILLFRGLPTWGSLPALCYLKGDVTESPYNRDVGLGFTSWTAEGRLVAPVATAPVSGSVTNDIVATMLAERTHSSIAASNSSKRNIDIAANPLGLGS